MSHDPYVAPSSVAAESSAPAPLTGRILAPLLVPLFLTPIALGLMVLRAQNLPVSALGGAILTSIPSALLCMVVISPFAMLALLPFRQLGWIKRGLLATLIQAVVIVLIGIGLYLYFGNGPINIELPQRPL